MWGCHRGRPRLAAEGWVTARSVYFGWWSPGWGPASDAFGDQHRLLQRAKASARLGLKRGVLGQVSSAGGEMLLGQTQKAPKGNSEWLGKEEPPWEIVSRVGSTFVR